jgi:hypothetical protein
MPPETEAGWQKMSSNCSELKRIAANCSELQRIAAQLTFDSTVAPLYYTTHREKRITVLDPRTTLQKSQNTEKPSKSSKSQKIMLS